MNDGLDVNLRTKDYLAGRRDTVDAVLEIIKEKEKGFGQLWTRNKDMFNFGWVSCAREIGKRVAELGVDAE